MVFDYREVLFPYREVRRFQDLLIQGVNGIIETGGCLVAHAPTGLGKTSSVLGPSIAKALKGNFTVFFLTPRHSQHRMVIETIRDICKEYGLSVPVIDLLGRQSMCPLPVSKELIHSDFTDYCKDMKAGNKCPYFRSLKGMGGERFLESLKSKSPLHSEELIRSCVDSKVCPYEASLELGRDARVIVCDYYYMFDDMIRKQVLARINKSLAESVIIVDEAHNLPDRIRELMTFKLSTLTLRASVKELRALGFDKDADRVEGVIQAIGELVKDDLREGLIGREEVVKKIETVAGVGFDDFVSDLFSAGETVRESNSKSFSLAVARFFQAWDFDSKDRVRMFRKESGSKGDFISLSCHCINPAEYAEPVLREAKASVLMSGTLAPVSMYVDVLGLNGSQVMELKSPFPQENRLTLIVPETTTRFSKRSDEEYSRIASKLSGILESLEVNTAVFFPSYLILNLVLDRLNVKKRVIVEKPGLSKEDRQVLLNQFRLGRGNVLFGVTSGSFGEGVDLPGSELECVVIVGIPLPVPDLYTKALINYYDRVYGKGWDYGYTLPALTKVIQSAGRCIRKETDRGLIILLDERYAWSGYAKCIPPEWIIKTTKSPEEEIRGFFRK